MHAPRQATSDLGFFSKSKTARPSGSGTTVSVTTRVVAVKKPTASRGSSGPSGSVQVVARDGTPSSSVSVPHKRKPDVPAAPSQVKRPRTSASPSVEPPSRASSSAPSARSHVSTREPSPLRSRRTSPSYSVSTFSTPEPPEPHNSGTRQWWTKEDGRPGSKFMSYERTIRENIKSYVTCASTLTICQSHFSPLYQDFKNPDDPGDKSFEAHPTDYPVVDLEFPNTGACERCVHHTEICVSI